jgi:hypothetical protein
MPSPELRAPVEVIRRAAEMACEEVSLRAVAGEVGLTPMGLRGFIRGTSKPQEGTLRKLNTWYTRHVASRVPRGEDDARAALVVLTGFYPRARRARVAGRLLAGLEAEFRDGGMAAPAWLAALRAELAEGADPAPGVESGGDLR